MWGWRRDITADHIMRANAAGIDLGFEGDEPLFIRADALLIGELIRNLIDNAITYAGPGAEVTVRVFHEGVVVLEVEDNGPGLTAEEIVLVRRRFARGGGKAKPGAGLGLPIVEEIATLFGGTLGLSQAEGGRGLKVKVLFPQAFSENMPPADEQRRLS